MIEEARLVSVEQNCVSLNEKLDKVLHMLNGPAATVEQGRSTKGPPWPALPGYPAPKHVCLFLFLDHVC